MDPDQVMANGTLMCGTEVITDLKKDLQQQEHHLLFLMFFLDMLGQLRCYLEQLSVCGSLGSVYGNWD